MTPEERNMVVPHECSLGCDLLPSDHFQRPAKIQDNGHSIWDEEMILSMTRGTWADLLDGREIGGTRVLHGNMIRVERKKR